MNHLLAAVDIGSNSFRLVIGRVSHAAGAAQLYPVDRLKETVRLAAGLQADQTLDDDTIARAIGVLERFGERLRSFDPDRVRAVATNTFRVAANIADVLPRAEAALGFPIEIIAGREEARLIFAGVAHSLPPSAERRLVVDIGGGSTEFIIGTGLEPELMESLPMGCVSYSRQFFADGRIDATAMKQAELAARREVEAIARPYRKAGWRAAFGSSGTAKALTAILAESGFSDRGITRKGMDRLKERLIKAGTVERAQLAGIKPDRHAVLPGGLAIMSALFHELDVDSMQPADGALRVGVLHDLLGRDASQDKRSDTVRQFMVRYGIDADQARRVREAALGFYRSLVATPASGQDELARQLGWAADLHEIGLSIGHAGYARHTAYVLENADMPGFSTPEQQQLALLALAHTGKLSKLDLGGDVPRLHAAILSLRLAVLLLRRREDIDPLPVEVAMRDGAITVQAPAAWLRAHPLTDATLHAEASEWSKMGVAFELLER